MLPFIHKHSYRLQLPDGRLLGQLRITEMDEDWAQGPFEPTSVFAEFRELFERESELRHQQVIPQWEKAYDAIESLGIEVIAPDGRSVGPAMRVFVDDQTAFLAPPLAANS